MKKILLAFDGSHFSESAFEFASTLNDMEPVLLTGIFLPGAEDVSLWSYSSGLAGGTFLFPPVREEDQLQVDRARQRFVDLCISNQVAYRVHKNFDALGLPELKKETSFADLLIIGSETFYANMGTEELNEYLKQALHDAECPVVVIPEKFQFPESNLLAYDGTESSAYAIKQFALLFPQLAENETLLVYSKADFNPGIPMSSYIEELAVSHYPHLTISKLNIDPARDFAGWVKSQPHSIIVSGSFGRSGFARWFRKSFIQDLIEGHSLPVFISHK